MRFYKSIFSDCWNQVINESDAAISLGKPVGDNSGNYEQEIATIFLNQTNNSPSKIIPVVQNVIIVFQQELNKRFKEFRLIEEIKDPIISRICTHFDSALNVTPYYHKDKGEHLCELKFSLKPWATIFGNEGVVVMLYQYKTTNGFAIRAFCKTENNHSNNILLEQCADSSHELEIHPIKSWTTWSTFFKEDSYPEDTYHMEFCAEKLSQKVIDSIERVDKHLSKIIDA